MAAKVPLTNFSKGEFAPALYGRVDIPEYAAGAKEITNFLIERYGGLTLRPGFQFVGEVDDVAGSYKILPFYYSTDQAYVLAFGDFSLRVLTQGGFVVEANLEITAITQENGAQVTAAFHALTVGRRVYFDGIEGMTELNGQYTTVTEVIDVDNFRIDVDTRGYGAFVSSDGDTRTEAPTPPDEPDPLPPPPEPTPPPSGTGGVGGTGGSYFGGGGGGWYPRTQEEV